MHLTVTFRGLTLDTVTSTEIFDRAPIAPFGDLRCRVDALLPEAARASGKRFEVVESRVYFAHPLPWNLDESATLAVAVGTGTPASTPAPTARLSGDVAGDVGATPAGISLVASRTFPLAFVSEGPEVASRILPFAGSGGAPVAIDPAQTVVTSIDFSLRGLHFEVPPTVQLMKLEVIVREANSRQPLR